MKTTTHRLALTAALIMAGFAAQAATDGAGHKRPSFEQIDTNSDGQISLEEMKALAKTRFDRVDANGDGELSAAEIKEHGSTRKAKRAEKMIERLDTDKNGSISYAEMQKAKPRKGKSFGEMFEHLDKNGDGSLSSEEFAAMKEMRSKHKRKD